MGCGCRVPIWDGSGVAIARGDITLLCYAFGVLRWGCGVLAGLCVFFKEEPHTSFCFVMVMRYPVPGQMPEVMVAWPAMLVLAVFRAIPSLLSCSFAVSWRIRPEPYRPDCVACAMRASASYWIAGSIRAQIVYRPLVFFGTR